MDFTGHLTASIASVYPCGRCFREDGAQLLLQQSRENRGENQLWGREEWPSLCK